MTEKEKKLFYTNKNNINCILSYLNYLKSEKYNNRVRAFISSEIKRIYAIKNTLDFQSASDEEIIDAILCAEANKYYENCDTIKYDKIIQVRENFRKKYFSKNETCLEKENCTAYEPSICNNKLKSKNCPLKKEET